MLPPGRAARGEEALRQLDGLDIGLHAEAERPDVRHLVAARGDVVIVHGEADVVDSAIPERLYDYLPL